MSVMRQRKPFAEPPFNMDVSRHRQEGRGMSDYAQKAEEALDERWGRPGMKPSARNRIGVAGVYALLAVADAIKTAHTASGQ